MDLKKGKVQKKKSFFLIKRFWFIVAAFFTLVMLLIAVVFTLALPLSTLTEEYCDQLPNDVSFCLTNTSYDRRRTYSTRTKYNQSVELLKTKVEPLNLPDGCEPVMFYMFSRHGIRYPKKDDIIKMEKFLPRLQAEMTQGYLCDQDFEKLRNWTLKMVPDNDNHVSPSGVNATKEIAKLFAGRYPNLFNPKRVSFQLGVTSKIRTTETARAFVDGLRELKPGISINDSDFVPRDFLEFHSTCKKIRGKDPKPKKITKITKSDLFTKVRDRVSKRIGLNRTISDEELDVVYRSCSFEQAIYEIAPWCALFTKNDLSILESREDIEHFYKNGPGLELNEKVACPVIKDLYEAVERAIRIPEDHTTYLYFSHAGALSRLWATLDVFDELSFYENYCLKSKSEWLTSEILPFNANFDAVLYRCAENNETTDPTDYKLVTMINGLPIEIDKCDEAACKADRFLEKYKEIAQNCDLDSICKAPKD